MTIIQNAAKIISNERNRLKTQKRKYCCFMRIAAHICWTMYWTPKQFFPAVDVYSSNLWHFREWISKYIDNRNTRNFLNNKNDINTIQIFSGYNRRQQSSCMHWEILSTTYTNTTVTSTHFCKAKPKVSKQVKTHAYKEK